MLTVSQRKKSVTCWCCRWRGQTTKCQWLPIEHVVVSERHALKRLRRQGIERSEIRVFLEQPQPAIGPIQDMARIPTHNRPILAAACNKPNVLGVVKNDSRP